jgi:hypothetical protein
VGRALSMTNGTISVELNGLPDDWALDVWVRRITPADLRTPFISIEDDEGQVMSAFFEGDTIGATLSLLGAGFEPFTVPYTGGWTYLHLRKGDLITLALGAGDAEISKTSTTSASDALEGGVKITLGNPEIEVHFDELWIYEVDDIALKRRVKVYDNQKTALGLPGDVVEATLQP